MSYFDPAILTRYGYTQTPVNTDLCELVTAIRKFDQTHTPASAPSHTPSSGVVAGTYPVALYRGDRSAFIGPLDEAVDYALCETLPGQMA